MKLSLSTAVSLSLCHVAFNLLFIVVLPRAYGIWERGSFQALGFLHCESASAQAVDGLQAALSPASGPRCPTQARGEVETGRLPLLLCLPPQIMLDLGEAVGGQ